MATVLKNPNGFTLIEVLVSLVIFSVMAAGFTRYAGEQARQTAYLSDKTLATVIASNVISAMQLAGEWPSTGQSSRAVTMAKRNWTVTVAVQDSAFADLRQLEVSVAQPEHAVQVTMTGFLGRH